MIVPALLEHNIKVFNERLRAVCDLPGINVVQIDFADGDFVASKTLTVEEIQLPHSKKIFEAHLMVHAPIDFNLYQQAGFKKIILHYEAFANKQDLVMALKEIDKLNMIPALAISPQTPVVAVCDFVGLVKNITLLGVVPGRQGQQMQDNVVDRIRELRDCASWAEIEIDGGVNPQNISTLIDAGVSQCVVGASLINGDIKKNYSELLNAIVAHD